MADAHRKWAEARAEELGHSKDDPQTDSLGCLVWKPAFMAGYAAALKVLERLQEPESPSQTPPATPE